MKKTLITLFAAVALATAAFALDTWQGAKGSVIRIEGTSTLHEWKMEGPTINGKIDAPAIERWATGGEKPAVHVAIPVTSIRSEHSKMDKLMADALKAQANPEVQYVMTDATLARTGDPFVIRTKGKLTIAGVTRDVDMDVTGTRGADDRYLLTGQAPIRMSDYGIKPPTAMMGTIRTGNDVKVTFRWVVEKAQ